MAVYARNSLGCRAVLIEPHSLYVPEIPDVIGFKLDGTSVAIECKTSRADYKYAERKKHVKKISNYRNMDDVSVGDYKYYCCPEGVIKSDELNEFEGLIYINEKLRARLVKIGKKKSGLDIIRKKNELKLMVCNLHKTQDPEAKLTPEQAKAINLNKLRKKELQHQLKGIVPAGKPKETGENAATDQIELFEEGI
jgi:Holliday junction resolvase